MPGACLHAPQWMTASGVQPQQSHQVLPPCHVQGSAPARSMHVGWLPAGLILSQLPASCHGQQPTQGLLLLCCTATPGPGKGTPCQGLCLQPSPTAKHRGPVWLRVESHGSPQSADLLALGRPHTLNGAPHPVGHHFLPQDHVCQATQDADSLVQAEVQVVAEGQAQRGCLQSLPHC